MHEKSSLVSDTNKIEDTNSLFNTLVKVAKLTESWNVCFIDIMRNIRISIPFDAGMITHKNVFYTLCDDDSVELWESGSASPYPSNMASLIQRMEHECKSELEFGVFNKDKSNFLIYAGFDHGYFVCTLMVNDIAFIKLMQASVDVIGYISDKKSQIDKVIQKEKYSLLNAVLSKVVHDLKSPLFGVNGFVQLISLRTKDSVVREYCKAIIDSLENVEHNNSELLKLARSECLIIRKKIIVVENILLTVINKNREIFTRTGINLNLSLNDEHTIDGDFDRLYSCFVSIVNNAKEAMVDGGALSISVSEINKHVKIDICDTGCGMPKYFKDIAFLPFESYNKPHAAGLGLTIAKSIVDAHKGRLVLNSNINLGTIVSIYLPFKKERFCESYTA